MKLVTIQGYGLHACDFLLVWLTWACFYNCSAELARLNVRLNVKVLCFFSPSYFPLYAVLCSRYIHSVMEMYDSEIESDSDGATGKERTTEDKQHSTNRTVHSQLFAKV